MHDIKGCLGLMQDANADNQDDELFSDALIAEMEADMYGLQVSFFFFLEKLLLRSKLLLLCFCHFLLFLFFRIYGLSMEGDM